MKKKILITGAFGYLGGRIAQHLSRDPGVFLYLGSRSAAREVPEWITRGKAVQTDFLRASSLQDVCREIDIVIHLAAPNEIQSASHPEDAIEMNGCGTMRLLDAAGTNSVSRFIYLSTIHVYGSPLAGTITEERLPRPSHPYSIAHRLAEDLVLAAHDRRVLTGIVLRLSNSFGAPLRPDVDRWTLVVNDLCRQAVTTRTLVLKTPGTQKRDFITLEDAARAVAHMAQVPSGQCEDGLFNLGGEFSLSIRDMAGLIARRCSAVFGFVPEIKHPVTSSSDVAEEIDYRIDRLKGTGFSLLKNIDEEIDATLQFCSVHFPPA